MTSSSLFDDIKNYTQHISEQIGNAMPGSGQGTVLEVLYSINSKLSSSSSSGLDLTGIESTLNSLLTNSNNNTDALANIDQGGLNWANSTGKSIPYWLKYNATNTDQIRLNSDTIVNKLDIIIAALQSGSSGGDEGSTETITQDWLKEETFTTARAEDNAATKQYRDWFKSAFGFGGGSSSPSLFNYFNREVYYRVRPIPWRNMKPDMLHMSYPFAPYEDPSYQYLSSNNWQLSGSTQHNFWGELSYLLADNLSNVLSNQRSFTLSTQALEYYAHTNLVATLWAIQNTPPPTGDSPTIGFTDGVLTYKDGSGSSGSSAPTEQTLDLNPASTNSYKTVVGDIKDVTGAITGGIHTGDNPIDTDAIRTRYFAYLDIKGASTSIGDDVGAASSSGETLKISFMGGSAELDLAAWGTSYRGVMTQERLKAWRGAMGIIWTLAAWIGGFYIVKRLGNME